MIDIDFKYSLSVFLISFLFTSKFGFNPCYLLLQGIRYTALPETIFSTEQNPPSSKKKGKGTKKEPELEVVSSIMLKKSVPTLPLYNSFKILISLAITALICLLCAIVNCFVHITDSSEFLIIAGVCVLFIFFISIFISFSNPDHKNSSVLYSLLISFVGYASVKVFPLCSANLKLFWSNDYLLYVIAFGAILGASIFPCTASLSFIEFLYNSPERIYQSNQFYPIYSKIFKIPRFTCDFIFNSITIFLLIGFVLRNFLYYGRIPDIYIDSLYIIVSFVISVFRIYSSHYWEQFILLDNLIHIYHYDRSRDLKDAYKANKILQQNLERVIPTLVGFILPSILIILDSFLFILSFLYKNELKEQLRCLSMFFIIAVDMSFSIATLFTKSKSKRK